MKRNPLFPLATLCLCVFGCAGNSPAVREPASFAPEVRDQVISSAALAAKDVMGKCGDRIWPGYSWKKLTVLFETKDPGINLAAPGGKLPLRKVPAFRIPDAARNTSFTFFQRYRSRWMSVSASYLEDSKADTQEMAEDYFSFAVHEAFHNLVQPGWSLSQSAGERGTDYPIQVTPRIQRRMLFEHLKQAFLHPEKAHNHLRKATYWLQKWQKEFPREAASTTDGYEGTARYAEYISRSLMHHGCDASEETLRSYIVSRFPKLFGAFVSEQVFELDSEGYDIGGLANLILRFQFPDRPWMGDVTGGKTPVQALLSRERPLAEGADPAITAAYQSMQGKLQKKADDLLGETLRLQQLDSTLLLAFPFEWQASGLTAIAFYLLPEQKMALTPLANEMMFASEDGDSRMTIHPYGVTTNDIPNNPCNTVWNIAVPAEAVQVNGDVYTVSWSKVSGSFHAEAKKSVDGRNWLCGK